MKKCTNCGQTQSDDVKFCYNCGGGDFEAASEEGAYQQAVVISRRIINRRTISSRTSSPYTSSRINSRISSRISSRFTTIRRRRQSATT